MLRWSKQGNINFNDPAYKEKGWRGERQSSACSPYGDSSPSLNNHKFSFDKIGFAIREKRRIDATYQSTSAMLKIRYIFVYGSHFLEPSTGLIKL